jgi:hypothetical protein
MLARELRRLLPWANFAELQPTRLISGVVGEAERGIRELIARFAHPPSHPSLCVARRLRSSDCAAEEGVNGPQVRLTAPDPPAQGPRVVADRDLAGRVGQHSRQADVRGHWRRRRPAQSAAAWHLAKRDGWRRAQGRRWRGGRTPLGPLPWATAPVTVANAITPLLSTAAHVVCRPRRGEGR